LGVAEPAAGGESAVVTATPAATGQVAKTIPAGEPDQAPRVKLPRTAWLAAIAVVVVAVGIFSWAFVISPRVFAPAVHATVDGGSIDVFVDNYPADQNVYLLVDGDLRVAQIVSTDSSRHVEVLVPASPGKHLIKACLDPVGKDCPAGTGPLTVLPPTVTATVSNTLVSVSVDNYPPNQNVYFFVDGAADQTALIDGLGRAHVLLLVDPGKHVITACLDESGNNCPAKTEVTR
jgi:hypothetical protein